MDWIQKRGYLLGTASLATLVLGGYLAIGWAPPDVNQHDVMRIMYVHVPSAWTAYLGFFGTLIGSVLYLWKQDAIWDTLAVAAAEIGVLMTALTLATGSTWGRPIWGVWWTWDPRLTSTAILFVIYSGYLMLRALQTNPAARARQAAVIGIIGFIDIPIVHFSVLWWRTLHQGESIGLAGSTIDNSILWPLPLTMIGFTCLFGAATLMRMRAELADARVEARIRRMGRG